MRQERDPARVVLPDGSIFPNPGAIDFADAQVNKDTGTISLRAVMPNGEPKLLPGMFVRVEVTIGERPDTILVPQKAVVKVPTGYVAWVVRPDGTAERRDLVVGEWYGDEWIVEKGLAAGEAVVVAGIQNLQPGIAVRAAPASAAPPATGAAPASQG
ncbi:MAG: efflux RND transporter periplasmic adaptor subunit [Acidobacteria bacterium]|nr:efflux RND transporter periplasmic adaptor subunit [Acidobacteriota bacterium]